MWYLIVSIPDLCTITYLQNVLMSSDFADTKKYRKNVYRGVNYNKKEVFDGIFNDFNSDKDA